MRGTRFFFIESKTFEFLIEGGRAPRVRINEMGRDIVRLVVMGRECAKRVVIAIDDLVSKPYVESFVDLFGWVTLFSTCNAVLIQKAIIFLFRRSIEEDARVQSLS